MESKGIPLNVLSLKEVLQMSVLVEFLGIIPEEDAKKLL